MNTIEINTGTRSIAVTAPISWNDLDSETSLLFYESLFHAPGDEFSKSAFTMTKLIDMTLAILKVDKAFLQEWEAGRIDADPDFGRETFLEELKQTIAATLGGLFEIQETEAGGTTYALKNNRTVNPWPELLASNGGTWYAPADTLDNITIYELATAFTYYENYATNPENEQLADLLLATIYRPSREETTHERQSGWGGDRRQPLRGFEAMVEDRAESIAAMPLLARRFLVFWFGSCRQYIVDSYPKVFKPSEEDKAGPGYGWGGVLLALAGGPVGLNAVADQNYGNALVWMSMKADEAEEAERRIEEMKR